MRMETFSANSQRSITDFVNENHISKEQIINIYQTREGEYIINYFVKE